MGHEVIKSKFIGNRGWEVDMYDDGWLMIANVEDGRSALLNAEETEELIEMLNSE